MTECISRQLAFQTTGSRAVMAGATQLQVRGRRRIVASRAACAHSSASTVGGALDRTVQIAVDQYVRI